MKIEYTVRAAGHTWPFWKSQTQTWKTEKQQFIDFVEQVECCSMSVTQLKTCTVTKRLTDHHHLIQQLHYSSQVQPSGTEGCGTFEQFNLASNKKWQHFKFHLQLTLTFTKQHIDIPHQKCLLCQCSAYCKHSISPLQIHKVLSLCPGVD